MAINAKRLLKLADYLETVPRERFKMSDWSNDKVGCGFAGCAIGWCAYAEVVPGFTMKLESDFGTDDFTGRTYAKPAFLLPTYEGVGGYDAVMLAFDVSEKQARHLFGANAYRTVGGTPKQVAKRIRKFVRENTKASAQ